MKEKTRAFLRDVTLTTSLSFVLITFLYVGALALFGHRADGGQQTLFQFYSYLFAKLSLCILPFCLILGFCNRLFSLPRHRAMLRLVHLLITFLAYFVFLDLLFLNLFQYDEVPVGNFVRQLIPYFVLYPLCVGVYALWRKVTAPREEKEYQTIVKEKRP